jgi:hypothetical protein
MAGRVSPKLPNASANAFSSNGRRGERVSMSMASKGSTRHLIEEKDRRLKEERRTMVSPKLVLALNP